MAASLKWHNEQDNSFVAANTTAAVGTIAPLGANGALASGNLIIVSIVVAANVGVISPPDGTWTLFNAQQVDATNVTTAHFWKLATGSESFPFNFTWTGSNFYGWGLLAFQDNDTTTPIDVSNTGIWASLGSTNADAVSISPTGSTDLLLGIWCSDGSSIAGPPSGMIERVDVLQESTTISRYVADQVLSASGATGNRSTTVATFDNGSWLLVAISPASPPTTTLYNLINVG